MEAIEEHQGLPTALGSDIERNALSNALAHRDVEHMNEAWMVLLHSYGFRFTDEIKYCS